MDIHKIAQEFHEVLKLPGLFFLTGFIILVKTGKKEKYLGDLEDIPGDNILSNEILMGLSRNAPIPVA
jgi:hypothetical protein